LCDRRLVLDYPSELPEHLRSAGAGRRIIMHGMHSVVDWFCFAVWEDGRLVRSLSLSPGSGIRENIGEPYDFEVPVLGGRAFRAGLARLAAVPAAVPSPGAGRGALRALFGFVVEGRLRPDDLDVEAVHLHGFRVTDPSGEEQAAREAEYEQARQSMGLSRWFRVEPDGTMQEVNFDSL
jgi:hypothetical protein